MSSLKLVYFNGRGRAEIIRLLLVAANQDFEDVRLPLVNIKDGRPQWSDEEKAEAPFGQLPYIIYKGKSYAQSHAIASFIAREHGLHGKNNLESLRIDEVALLISDLRPHIREWGLASDEAKKAEAVEKLKNEIFPCWLRWLENLLLENGTEGFFVGNKVTMAELITYDVLYTMLGIDSNLLELYPNLKKLQRNVEAIPSVKEYLANRPKTPL